MRTLSIIKSLLLPIGLAVIGVLAVIVMTDAAPERTTASLRTADASNYYPENQASIVQKALSDFEANEARADSAPKQQVVAGWVTRDLLAAIALQNASTMDGIEAVNDNLIEMQSLQSNITKAIEASVAPIDDRPRRLLTLAVLALCWIGMWSVIPGLGSRRKVEAEPPVAPAVSAPSIGGASGEGTGSWAPPAESA